MDNLIDQLETEVRYSTDPHTTSNVGGIIVNLRANQKQLQEALDYATAMRKQNAGQDESYFFYWQGKRLGILQAARLLGASLDASQGDDNDV